MPLRGRLSLTSLSTTSLVPAGFHPHALRAPLALSVTWTHLGRPFNPIDKRYEYANLTASVPWSRSGGRFAKAV